MDQVILLAALGFGVFAAITLRRKGRPVLAGLGYRFSRLSGLDFLVGLVITGVAVLGTRDILFALGLHVSGNFTQSLLGFPVSGQSFPGLLVQDDHGSAIVTGGAFGPEAGLVGMGARVLVFALVIGYLTQRYRDGSLARLEYAPEPVKRGPRRALPERPAERPDATGDPAPGVRTISSSPLDAVR